MYLDHPQLSATNGDTEPDRIERLNRVYGYVIGLADHVENTTFIGKLSRFHDHKGTLVVTWFEAPADDEKNYCARAWRSLVGDGSDRIEHHIERSQA